MTEAIASHITQGALRAIFDDAGPRVSNPVLQCLQCKAMETKGGGTERYRVVLSDIRNHIQTMLAQHSNHVVTEGGLKKGSLVRLKEFDTNNVRGKRILILLKLDVLSEYGEHEKIGAPVTLDPVADQKTEEVDIKPQPQGIAGGNFYGSRAPQPMQDTSHTRTNANSAAHANLHPIEALSPYAHKWTIRARCTHKSDIKTWHNKNGEGKLFSVNLLDESGEIRATGFKAECDMLYDVFQEGGVYYISSPCRVQLAKKQFTNLDNDYELTFERDTHVEKAESQDSVPKMRYNFTSIGDLQSVENQTTIDTIAILKEVGAADSITSKTTGKPYDKRELTLVDNSGYSVRLTIWGNSAVAFEAPEESVVAFKGVKVSDFGGRSLSLLSSGSMTVDPDIDEAFRLRGWYDAAGRQDTFQSHQSMTSGQAGGRAKDLRTIAQIKDIELLTDEQQEYVNLKASIIHIRPDNFSYPACNTETCTKKVTEIDPGQWHCEKCNITHPQPEYRYILSMNVGDHTGQLWVSCFDDQGKVVMGMSANQLNELRENDEPAKLEALSEANCKTYTFRVRVKVDHFQDTRRVRYQVTNAYPLNYAAECMKLIEALKKYDEAEGLFVQ